MAEVLTISNVRFTAALELDRQTGLLGWISCDLDGLHFDGLTLRRSNHGRRYIAYPSRSSSGGHKYAVARPIIPELAVAIEERILAVLQAQGVAQ